MSLSGCSGDTTCAEESTAVLATVPKAGGDARKICKNRAIRLALISNLKKCSDDPTCQELHEEAKFEVQQECCSYASAYAASERNAADKEASNKKDAEKCEIY